ncbi:MAG TPA: type II secretion system protein [Gaiellaceae bacterium]|nr:type II secretion system protein [Gaiellaceae bacterium]
MISRIKTRLSSQEGFTLIELLVVIVILGILVAIAVPSYLSFRGRAQDSANKSNIRSAIPAAEAYYQDNSSSYTGMDAASPDGIFSEATGLSPDLVVTVSTDGQQYCIADTSGGNDWHYNGGTGGASTIASGACDAFN